MPGLGPALTERPLVCLANHAINQEQFDDLADPEKPKSQQPNHTRDVSPATKAMDTAHSEKTSEPQLERDPEFFMLRPRVSAEHYVRSNLQPTACEDMKAAAGVFDSMKTSSQGGTT
jgi:hypothetical protein